MFSSFDSVDYKVSKEATIVAFGDSLTAGYGSTKDNDYVTVLSKTIAHPIVNLGIPGDTTENALLRVNQVIDRKPELVIVFLGGNDLLRRVPVDTTFNNLDKILQAITDSGAKIVLVGVPGSVIGDKYEKRFEALAKKYNAIYVPQFMSRLIARREYMHDAIHPNDEGYKIVAEKIYEKIKEII